jgi:hypothetical protein
VIKQFVNTVSVDKLDGRKQCCRQRHHTQVNRGRT